MYIYIYSPSLEKLIWVTAWLSGHFMQPMKNCNCEWSLQIQETNIKAVIHTIVAPHQPLQNIFRKKCYEIAEIMMTSSNGNIFRVTGPLCGEFTGHRWIPNTMASDAELWCFLWSALE